MIRTLCVALAAFILAACGGKRLSEDVMEIRSDLNRVKRDVESLKQRESSGTYRLNALSDELSALKTQSLLLSGAQQAPVTAPETVPADEPKAEPASASAQTPQKPRIVIIEDIEVMSSTLYSYALELYNQKKYDDSIEKFQEFLSRFPSDPLAPNAQYWLGENCYAMKDYEKALEAFKAVASRWPDSAKAPDALLKEGYSYNNMGQRAEAVDSLSRLTKNFPSSSAAALARKTLARW